MKTYLLLRPEEDGEPTKFLDENDLQELLDDPIDNYGIKKFLSREEVEKNYNPQAWNKGEVALFEVNLLEPKIKTTEWKLE